MALKFEALDPETGEHMPLAEFLQAVTSNCFIDYDGYGELATATEVSNVTISPSQVGSTAFPEWATHVMWYNR